MESEAMALLSKKDSDLEIAIKLHDYLVDKMTYAYIGGTTIPESEVWAHNIVGGAAYRSGVCEMYAKTYLYLCSLGGVECIFVSGYAGESHAWNYVKLDGEWYAVDVTWDDGGNEYLKYKYFALSESSMALDHTPDGSDEHGLSFLFDLPETASRDMCPVILYENGVVIDTFKSAEAAFEVMTETESEYVLEFYLNDSVVYATTLPPAESITFVGLNEVIDEQYFYGNSTLVFTEEIEFSGDVTFRNVCVSGVIDLSAFTLTTEGIFCRLSGFITGDEGALIRINTSYKTDIDAENSVRTEDR